MMATTLSADRLKRMKLALLFGDGPTWRSYDAPANGALISLQESGIGSSGLCTVLLKVTFAAVATGIVQTLFSIDDGTSNNLFSMRQQAANTQTQVLRTLGGVTSNTNTGAVSAGAVCRFGMSIPGDGAVRGCTNGATVITVTGGPISGLTTLRIGNGPSGSSPLSAPAALVRVLPGIALSDADLRAAVNAL